MTLPPDIRRVFVTGAAGFIGSNLVDRLLASRVEVVGYDNLSTGMMEFLSGARRSAKFSFIEGDVLDGDALSKAMAGADLVFHLAANADVRFGFDHPDKDLEQNTIATFRVLEAMRTNGVPNIAFASTGSIYGEASVIPTPETAPFPIQTSLYGASKLAGEGLIAAYCEGYGMRSWIFRFVSILGERYTHGHVIDFYARLRIDPTLLTVLGDGHQRKSYLYVQDCIDAMLHAVLRSRHKVSIFNIGSDEFCEVRDSIGWIIERMKVAPKLEFSSDPRGWIGDNPFILLDIGRIRKLGWEPKLRISAAIVRTLEWLDENRWVLDRRPVGVPT